ncbi:MAG: type 1 glutamine amidotransferase [Erysipelothrix sp.]|nr:type 1 glutamine amidotransferase [Erysipelothrix sp.]
MRLEGKRLLTIVSEDYDDLEFHYPIIRLKEEGARIDIASLAKGEKINGKYGLSTVSDMSFGDVDITQYDGLLIPGGWSPDYLRRFDDVLGFAQYMDKHNKLIGIICHAGWVLSSADILKGRTVTSTPGIKHDLMHAGATWVDEAALIDGNIVSGRRPPDLHEYLPMIIEVLMKQK